jgi:glutamyl-tRNA reductase
MQLFLLGLNHKTAPVEVREQLALSPSRVAQALRFLREQSGAHEAAILSTCNRAEIYAVGSPEIAPRLERFLDEFQHVSPRHIQPYLYRQHDENSARHLFRVAAGIDSLVLGESEILGQVKTAMEAARSNGALSNVLDELFRRAIACGKRARHETAISRGALNVGSAAVELARQIFGPLTGHTVLILGAGKMSSLTAQHLVASGARRVLVANRTYARAQELAQRFSDPDTDAGLNGIPAALSEAVTWEEFPQRLIEADIVIASTRAPHLVLTSEQVAQAMKARRHRPLFLIDIAVPRDIDPQAHQLDNVFLYDIDDLQSVVTANLAQRAQELNLVERIIEDEVSGWRQWYASLDAKPVMAALARHAEEIRTGEVEAALSQLSHLSERDQQIVRALAKSISGKLIHAPLRHLREAAEHSPEDVEAIRRAFNLHQSTLPPHNGSRGEGGENK